MPFEVKSFPVKYLILPLMLITALPAIQGCATAAVPAVAYGVSKITAPAPAAAQPAAPQHTYPEYLTEMERINLEREKSGLSPRPIMTQEEWAAAEAGHPAAASASPPAAPAAPACDKTAETK